MDTTVAAQLIEITDSNRLSGQARQYGDEVVTPVEAVLEFRKVARHMLFMDGPVGPDDGHLDVAERGGDPLERRHTGCGRAGATGIDP